jgi:hypothetical protein
MPDAEEDVVLCPPGRLILLQIPLEPCHARCSNIINAGERALEVLASGVPLLAELTRAQHPM